MRPRGHFVSSLIGAGLLYSLLDNFISAVLFFISSFFIDIDHIFDYIYQKGLKNFSIRAFLESCDENKLPNFAMVFHSFELLLVLWIFITVYKLNIFWISFTLGISIHLIIDQFTNASSALSYFFIYRCLKNFETKELFLKKK